jgi:hypothetical protein
MKGFWRFVLGWGSCAALATVLATRMLYQTEGASTLGTYAAVLVGLTCMLVTVPVIIGRFDGFEFINVFVFFYFLSYVIRPLVLMLSPEHAVFTRYWELPELGSGVYYVALGLASFAVGYYSPAGVRLGTIAPGLPVETGAVRASLVFFGIVGLSLGAYLLHAWLLGGIGVFLEGLIYERSWMYYGYGWLVPFQNLALVAVPFGYAYVFSERWLRPLFILCAGAIIALLLIPMSRGVFLNWVVMLIAYRHYAARPVRLPTLIGIAPVAVCLLVGLQLAREWNFGIVQNLLLDEVLLYTYSTTFNGFDGMMMVLTYYERTGEFFYGSTFLEAFVYPWMPRALWPTKPFVYGGTAITEPIGGFFSGGTHVNAEILGELYANFGPSGIIVGMMLVGIAGRALYVACCAPNRRSMASYLFYAYIVAIIPGWQRIGIGGSVYYLLTFFAPFAFVLWLVQRRVRINRAHGSVTPVHA